jgi:hypothetical protein
VVSDLGASWVRAWFQPSSHVIKQRPGPRRADSAAFVGRFSLDLLFDPVKGGDALPASVAIGDWCAFIRSKKLRLM